MLHIGVFSTPYPPLRCSERSTSPGAFGAPSSLGCWPSSSCVPHPWVACPPSLRPSACALLCPPPVAALSLPPARWRHALLAPSPSPSLPACCLCPPFCPSLTFRPPRRPRLFVTFVHSLRSYADPDVLSVPFIENWSSLIPLAPLLSPKVLSVSSPPPILPAVLLLFRSVVVPPSSSFYVHPPSVLCANNNDQICVGFAGSAGAAVWKCLYNPSLCICSRRAPQFSH